MASTSSNAPGDERIDIHIYLVNLSRLLIPQECKCRRVRMCNLEELRNGYRRSTYEYAKLRAISDQISRQMVPD